MTANEDPKSPTVPPSDNSVPDTDSQSGQSSTDTDINAPAAPAETINETEKLEQPEPAFGWTAYAEQINGRFAMIGFVLLLILEAVTGQDFFTWLGLR